MRVAVWAREWAAGFAEWICPELNPDRQSSAPRAGFFLFAAALAALVAFVLLDARAGVDFTSDTVPMRARAY